MYSKYFFKKSSKRVTKNRNVVIIDFDEEYIVMFEKLQSKLSNVKGCVVAKKQIMQLAIESLNNRTDHEDIANDIIRLADDKRIRKRKYVLKNG